MVIFMAGHVRKHDHDDAIKWKHFPCNWSFVQGIHQSLVNSPHKGQWCWALVLTLICALNKRFSKQLQGWWFEMPLHPLWHHCNVYIWQRKNLDQTLKSDKHPICCCHLQTTFCFEQIWWNSMLYLILLFMLNYITFLFVNMHSLKWYVFKNCPDYPCNFSPIFVHAILIVA